MALPGSLLDSVLKYRKQRQQPGGPGVPRYAGQCDFARPVTRVPGGGRGSTSGGSIPTPEVYMGDLPQDYLPHPGFMEIPEPDYEPYEGPFVQASLTPAPPGFGGMPPVVEPSEVEYEDSLMPDELFGHLMRESSDLEELTRRLVGALDQGPTLPPPVTDVNRSLGDLYAGMGPQDFFEQQMQAFESQFRQFETMQFGQGAQMEEVFRAQEALFDLSNLGGLLAEPAMPGPQSLDDIVEAYDLTPEAPPPGYGPDAPGYDDCLMTPELFGELMHEAATDMMPQEAAPVPYDIGMMPGGMYGEPMPDDMMEPEMMDPDMMPGPMGPGFGPEPPPGP